MVILVTLISPLVTVILKSSSVWPRTHGASVHHLLHLARCDGLFERRSDAGHPQDVFTVYVDVVQTCGGTERKKERVS